MDWTVWLWCGDALEAEELAAPWLEQPWVAQVLLFGAESGPPGHSGNGGRLERRRCDGFISGQTLRAGLAEAGTPYLAVVGEPWRVRPEPSLPRRAGQLFEAGGAGLIYSYWRREESEDSVTEMVTPAFQEGSARDTFPPGPLVCLKVETAQGTAAGLADSRWSGLDELKLRLAESGAVRQIPEARYRARPAERRAAGEQQFDYLRPEFRARQLELESVFTEHLRRTGAWLPPPQSPLPSPGRPHPCLASIVIPVRDRVRTIGEAIDSAAGQRASFEFNVLVVDNHSSDGTSEVISARCARYPHVRHLQPAARGLGIGGCWQVAIDSPECGLYAVQLDSDDLYLDERTLQAMVDLLQSGGFGLAVGSYRLVDQDLAEIPPGVIDHREWTAANGHHNLLRVEGIGAPRAFHVPALRAVGFPDVSYGEDYAVALALSRRYPVGRIFEPLYLCRRWPGNSDAGLTSLQQARHHEYKDFLRSTERAIRRKIRPSSPS